MISVRLTGAMLLLALAGACNGNAIRGPSFHGEAREVLCGHGNEAARCFRISVRNTSSVVGDGECWVAAIRDFSEELGRSEHLQFVGVGAGQVVTGMVSFESHVEGENVTFPVHCDPAPEG